mgnify:CR=1 FL=1
MKKKQESKYELKLILLILLCALAFTSGMMLGNLTSPETRAEYENYIRSYCKQLPIDKPGTYCIIVDNRYITPDGDTIRVKA